MRATLLRCKRCCCTGFGGTNLAPPACLQLLAALNPGAAEAAATLAAADDTADDLERLRRAGSAAAVHPTLRVRGGLGLVRRGWGAAGVSEHEPRCSATLPVTAAFAGAGCASQRTLAPPVPLLQESASSSSSSSSSSVLQRPDGDAELPGRTQQAQQQRPDGDMEVADGGRSFRVPPCSSCGGILKPSVVYFGDSE